MSFRAFAAVLVGLIGLGTIGVQAQDGLRSASLPERPIATLPPGPGDLFRAGPNTYRPRDSGPPRPSHPIAGPGRPGQPGGGWPYAGWGYWPYWDQSGSTNPPPSENSAPEGGRLQLRIAPSSALVYIDGAFEGMADDLREPGARLRAGVHRIRMTAPGFETHTTDVRVEDGGIVTYRVALDRETAPVAAPVMPVAGPPAVARTLYVIPRCYAGDTPPAPTTTCDLTQLRTIR